MIFCCFSTKLTRKKLNLKKEIIMATRYIVETEGEALTEGDLEFLGIEETEMMESIEAELAEDTATGLEDVNVTSVAESLEGLMEGLEEMEAPRNGSTRRTPSRTPSSYVNNQLLKTFTIIIKKLVKKIKSNPRTRPKLQAATRKGPTAVAQLITPSVRKVLPKYFQWMAPIYVPPVTRVLFNPIRKEAGVEAAEVEGSSEWGAEWDL
jgi:hypothetical protein